MFQMIFVSLIKEVVYPKNGMPVTVPEDTLVQYDPINEVAFWNGDRFDLFKDEFSMTH